MAPAKTVLIVEDQQPLAEVYRIRLMAEGYQVWIAADGESAIDMALQLQPSLILLDMMLPKRSGFGVLESLHQHPNLAQTKIIVMSALAEKVDKERGFRLGVSNWLVKSQATLEEVMASIRSILNPAGPAMAGPPAA